MKDKITDVLMTKKTVFGFHVADLLGIILMIIPCLISIPTYKHPENVIEWLPSWLPFNQREGHLNITPDISRALIAVAFYYGALIARYGIFKKDNLMEALISSVRTFLNCWGLAALLGIVLTTNSNETFSLGIFSINTASLLLFLVVWHEDVSRLRLDNFCPCGSEAFQYGQRCNGTVGSGVYFHAGDFYVASSE